MINCMIDNCPFYNFRFSVKRKLTEEQKEILKERLVKARVAKREKKNAPASSD